MEFASTCPHQIFQSRKIRFSEPLLSLSIRATPEFPSLASLYTMRAFSSAVRNLACSGQSAIKKKDTIATAVVASPSMIKILMQISD